MNRDELLPMEGKRVALTAKSGDDATIAYHGVIMKVSEKAVIMGMGTTRIPTPVLIAHVEKCIEFADQSTYKKGMRS